MIDSAVVKEYTNRHKSNIPRNWIEIVSASGDKITLTQFDVHNKTVYTIFPNMSQSGDGLASGMDAMSLSNVQRADNSTKPQEIKQVEAPRTVKPLPSANGGLIGICNGTGSTDFKTGLSDVDKQVNLSEYDMCDMLATLAMIPVAVPPAVSSKPGEYFDVYVSLAANPNHFWVEPYDNVQAGGAFHLLLQEMKTFYDNEENRIEVHGSTVKKGLAFAFKQPDSYWYRVIVDDIVPGTDPVEVVCFFVDCGDIRVIKVEELQPLYTQYQKLPWQAMKAKLSSKYNLFRYDLLIQ